MARYRAFYLGQDANFIKADEIIAEDDRTAILAARALLGAHDIELWDGDRRIVKFDGLNSSRIYPKE